MLDSLLNKRLSARELLSVCNYVRNDTGNAAREELYSLAGSADVRVSYNALWCLTWFNRYELDWLANKRNELIDRVLVETHVGRKRLLLTLLDRLPVPQGEFRCDYYDFCLSNIISSEPVGIRSLSIKQAYAQCRDYPDLLPELRSTIELLDVGRISPGLRSVSRRILQSIAKR